MGNITKSGENYKCSICDNVFPFKKLSSGNKVPDFRCLGIRKTVSLSFEIPHMVLGKDKIESFGYATKIHFNCISREKIRKTYGTKLQKEILYYLDKYRGEKGKNLSVLDLGCGSGGNKRYLKSIGVDNVLSVDYDAPGAEYLVDVHRLPFSDESFDLILTTSTIEHFYNPFIAFAEMNRVLKKDGVLIASGSFWESWHGNSCFHFTPNGFYVLCQTAGFELIDLWSGWGFIPSICSHALGLGKIKFITYKIQNIFDWIIRFLYGKSADDEHRLKTSGSFGICAKKGLEAKK